MLNFTGKCNYIENFQRLGGAAGGGTQGKATRERGRRVGGQTPREVAVQG